MKTRLIASLLLATMLAPVRETAATQNTEAAVQEQIDRLRADDLLENRAAMAQLIAVGSQAVEPLIATLTHRRELTRISAAEALGRIGDPRAVEPLIERMQDRDSAVRWSAAEALGLIGDPRAVDPLIDNLREPSPQLRGAVVEALSRIGDARAVEPLIGFLRDENPETRIAAARVVGRLGTPDHAPALLPCLNDPNAEVRRAAAEALGRMHSTAAVEPLITMLREDNAELRLTAIEALGLIGDQRAVPPMLRLMQQYDATLRITLATALGRLRAPEGVTPVIGFLRDDRRAVRAAAAGALAAMGNVAVPALIVCLNDFDTNICATAAELLGRIGHPDARDPLIPLLTHESRRVRTTAAAALDAVGYLPDDMEDRITLDIAAGRWQNIAALGGPAFDILIERLQAPDSQRRILAYEALEKAGARHLDLVKQALRHERPAVRMFAAEALGNIGDPQAIPALTALQNDANEFVRRRAAQALNRLGKEVPIPEITVVLTDRDTRPDDAAVSEQPDEPSDTGRLLDLPLLDF